MLYTLIINSPRPVPSPNAQQLFPPSGFPRRISLGAHLLRSQSRLPSLLGHLLVDCIASFRVMAQLFAASGTGGGMSGLRNGAIDLVFWDLLNVGGGGGSRAVSNLSPVGSGGLGRRHCDFG
ncbi:hypothetical protein BDZ45DRAFT_475779 [Acephala macrosclerotiorum]|nr:hypothetical protein BDZ45DRAFT_475779 [Acephala macrosclerotiorum]